VCVCVCVCVCYLDFQYDFYVSIQPYKVVKGTSKSLTDEMRTASVTRTTDMLVAKDSKLTWHKMCKIDIVSIVKENFIEKDKDRSKYWWLPKMVTGSQGLGQISVSASILASIKSILHLGNTFLGDGEMEKIVVCRMNRDFIIFVLLLTSRRRTVRRRTVLGPPAHITHELGELATQ